MKAVTRTGPGTLALNDMATPVPAAGQVLARSLACGICGSDLHALHHMEHMRLLTRGASAPPVGPMVFGHQFSAEIVEHGPGTSRTLPVGTTVVTMPYVTGPSGPELVGYSERFPGAFAEYILLDEALLLPVRNGLSYQAASMVEPLAVGEHAVNAARFSPGSVAMVIGCGQIGLAVVAALKARGFGPVIAADFAPSRRRVAEALGADIVVDPAIESPHAQWAAFDVPETLTAFAAARRGGLSMRDAIIFECVGAPGMLQKLIAAAPPATQIIVAGVCMQTDQIEPVIASGKELSLRFVNAYDGAEFARMLDHVAEGRIDAAAMVSSSVGLAGVEDAFRRLATPDSDVTILVEPSLVQGP